MVDGKGEGLQADIYMFGATLYEMLSGRPPYVVNPECDGNEQARDIYRHIHAGPPEPIRRLCPDVPDWLAHIVDKAMERDIERRYATMDAVLRDLNAAGAGRAKRRGWLVVLGSLALIGLIGALSFWGVPGAGQSADTNPLREVRSIRVPGVREWSCAVPGDWDGDDMIDLFVPQNDGMVVISTEGELLAEHRLKDEHDGPVRLELVDDLDGDGRDEAFLNWAFDTSTFIDVVTQNQFRIRRLTAPGAALQDMLGERDPSVLAPAAIADLDHDGHAELVAYLRTGFQKAPSTTTLGDGAWLT
jgi:hypothetical protein